MLNCFINQSHHANKWFPYDFEQFEVPLSSPLPASHMMRREGKIEREDSKKAMPSFPLGLTDSRLTQSTVTKAPLFLFYDVKVMRGRPANERNLGRVNWLLF